MKSAIAIITIAACFFMTAGCKSQSKEFTEQKLVIASKETVNIKEAHISITNNGCGRKWIVEDGRPASERPYCELFIKYKDSTLSTSTTFEPLYLGDVQIRMDKMNPWGAWEDHVPPGGCRVWIRRSPAFVLLQKYGWSPEIMINETSLAFPDTLSAQPFVQYASSTQAIGFDLNSLAGRTLTILKIKLKEKGKRSGTNLWAHIVIDDGEAVTGWLSSQVLAQGLAPLNLSKDKLGDW